MFFILQILFFAASLLRCQLFGACACTCVRFRYISSRRRKHPCWCRGPTSAFDPTTIDLHPQSLPHHQTVQGTCVMWAFFFFFSFFVFSCKVVHLVCEHRTTTLIHASTGRTHTVSSVTCGTWNEQEGKRLESAAWNSETSTRMLIQNTSRERKTRRLYVWHPITTHTQLAVLKDLYTHTDGQNRVCVLSVCAWRRLRPKQSLLHVPARPSARPPTGVADAARWTENTH